MPKWLDREPLPDSVVRAVFVMWFTYGAVSAALQDTWGVVFFSVVAAATFIIVATTLVPKWQSAGPSPSVRKWLGPVVGALDVFLLFVAVSWTIGGVTALANTEWAHAFDFLLQAAFMLVLRWDAFLVARKERRASDSAIAAVTPEPDRGGERVVVLRFGSSRLKVAKRIHRLRADARLPVMLIDYGALPFVAGEGLSQDVAARWVDELSAVGADARVQ